MLSICFPYALHRFSIAQAYLALKQSLVKSMLSFRLAYGLHMVHCVHAAAIHADWMTAAWPSDRLGEIGFGFGSGGTEARNWKPETGSNYLPFSRLQLGHSLDRSCAWPSRIAMERDKL